MTSVNMKAGRVVVVGASMAGLIAARVLSDYYAEVVLVDRDVFADRPEHRAQVPQSHHAHGLLSPGRDALISLFPGWEHDIRNAGGTAGVGESPGLDLEMKIYVVRGSNLVTLPAWWSGGVLASRALIEHTVRRRVAALPNVTITPETAVVGLRTDAGGRRVTGVETTDATIEADLVVDASGRTSRLPEWLDGLGYDTPRAEVVRSNVHYASCFVELDADFHPDYLVVLGAQVTRGQSAGGVFTRVENNMMQCTLATVGPASNRPPTDPDGYRAFAATTGIAAFAEILDHSRLVSPIKPYRVASNRLLRYDQLDRHLEGVVALGDSVCAFNPAYGQGMSVAASSALALGKTLESDGGAPGPGFESRAARRIAAAVRPAWTLAVSEDRRAGCVTEGIRKQRARGAAEWFQERLERGAVDDPELALALGDVVQLRRPLASLGAPRVVARTLFPRARGWAPVPSTSPQRGFRATDSAELHTDHEMVGDVALHYAEAGEPSRETVLFLHGWPDLWLTWEPMLHHFARAGYHVLAPDQRGYGRSSKPARVADYRIDRLAADIATFVEQRSGGPVHVVGHDWGGVVAWALAAERPDLLRSLTVLNAPHPGVFIDGLLRRPAQQWRSWYMVLFQVPGLVETILGARDTAPLAFLLGQGAGLDADTVARYREQWRNPAAVRAPLKWYRALFRALITDRKALRHQAERPISVPTQVVWGTRDGAFAPGTAEASAARVDGELHLLDTGHWPHHDSPEAVTRLLTNWLHRHSVPVTHDRVALG